MPTQPGGSDTERGARADARLVDKIGAVQLVLASRDLVSHAPRQFDMIAWLLDAEPEPEGNCATKLFLEAIKATKP